jgi:segregation and condensation protein A
MALDEAADYLDMAARLVRIKAQLLLPRSGNEEAWEDPRAELVRRLLEYQQVREVVDHLDLLGERRRGRFSRGAVPQRELAADLRRPRPAAPPCRSPSSWRRWIGCCAPPASRWCTTWCRARST